jgi:hypothetical protein
MAAHRSSAPRTASRSPGADTVRQAFAAALDRLVEEVRADRSILAVLLGGSLSHDTVWEKSDIDLLFVAVDDRKIESTSLCLDADGVNVHAIILPRAEFRRIAEGALRQSFMHSFLAKSRLVYTHDPTIAELCAGLATLGARDQRVQLLRAAMSALPPLYKARKWFITRQDLHYAALWILYTATPLAQVELIRAGRLVDREVIPQALALNPPLFDAIYTGLLNERKTPARIQRALEVIDRYLRDNATDLFSPVLEHLAEVGEARSCRDIEDHFTRTFGIEDVTTACEYLADEGLIGRAAIATRVTRRGTVTLQELAYYALAAR